MVKQFLLFTLLGVPMLGYSQAYTYGSVGEKTQNGLTLSHALDYKANVESADGMLAMGPMAQYTVAATTGLDLVDVTLLSVYPNPTADVLVLKTGELKNVTYAISDASGKQLRTAKVKSEEERIDFSNYVQGVYHLSVVQDGRVLKTFSIVKK